MRAFNLILVVLTLGMVSPLPGRVIATPTAFTCPVTKPVSTRPPERDDPFSAEDAVFFEDGIWVNFPADGLLQLGEDTEIEFGKLQGWRTTTVTWMRDEGVQGWVIVTGERLDERSALSPRTPLSPQRQYVQAGFVKTGIAFPSEGCWEVTGTVASPLSSEEHAITWVMDVRFLD